MRLHIENIGEHAHWRSGADNETFLQRVADGTFGWVEVTTECFEVHSRLERFQKTIEDPRWAHPADLAALMQRYTFAGSHTLAGFSGPCIPDHPEVHGWANSKGLQGGNSIGCWPEKCTNISLDLKCRLKMMDV